METGDPNDHETTTAAAAAAAAAQSTTFSSRPTVRRSSVLDPLMAAQAANAVNGNANAGASNDTQAEAKEVQNARALQVLARVKEKLTGRDFKRPNAREVPPRIMKDLQERGLQNLVEANQSGNAGLKPVSTQVNTVTNVGDFGYELPVDDQVDKLLAQATSVENLCQHYIGWCSFW